MKYLAETLQDMPSYTDEVRENVPSFHKVTLFYDIKYSTETLSIYVIFV